MSWRQKANVYVRLMRLDRPVGIYLLGLPGWWGIVAATTPGEVPDWWLLLLFALGAVLMRSAGCVINDVLDQKFDAKVARTAKRPIAAGLIDKKQALLLFTVLCLLGFLILIQFNVLTILLGILSVGLLLAYPLMKRFTWWPQAFLGLTFNWGILMGWVAVHGTVGLTPLLLYLGAIAWTVGYDTIYASQDIEDDVRIGVKSTALKFQSKLKPFVALCYSVALLFWWCGALAAEWHWWSYLGLVFIALHFLKQLVDWHSADPLSGLQIFKRNVRTALILLGILLLANIN